MSAYEANYPIARKGMQLFCKNCNDHILTMKLDIHRGMLTRAEMFEPESGQKPRNGDPYLCKKCNTPWYHVGYISGRWVDPEERFKQAIHTVEHDNS